jgi:hypothetical protein
MQPLQVAILADTHIRSTPEDPQACYPSDGLMNARARRVVELIRARDPDLAVHLGDVTHTLPALSAHGPTQRQARELLWSLDCAMMVAPGNHDVGDKPSSRASAARADRAAHDAFILTWGPPWMSLDHGGCRFITLDSPIMDTGDPMEAEQWTWLEDQLTEAQRSFVFLHYPPFLLHPDEPAHYDNLGLVARRRLLSLLAAHRVEAVFAGHVHNFFHHRHQGTEHWLLPSTAFVRPEYSELFPVPPLAENGRDDPDKIGFAMLHVDPEGHRLEWVCPARVAGDRSEPPAPSPVGVWLRGGWARTVDLPAGDLDPFDRKRARNDWTELALMDLGLHHLRVQLADLDDPELGPRLRDLAAQGYAIQVASLGPPSHGDLAILDRHHSQLDCWELILPPSWEPRDLASLARCPLPVALSVVDPGAPGPGGYHSHFPEQGFTVDSVAFERLRSMVGDAPPRALRWLAFRVPHDQPIWPTALRAHALADSMGLEALCHVELARGSEREPPSDLHAASRRAAEASLVAAAQPRLRVMLDGLTSKDRGYHPRPGLLDRRCNPLPPARVLRSLAQALAGSLTPEALGDGRWLLGDVELWLTPSGEGPWHGLVDDAPHNEAPKGPALRLLRPQAPL